MIGETGAIRFGRAVCNDLAQAERREWWLANGRGGYAAGTVAGTLTRRYHGLLVAALDKPVGRRVTLARADASVEIGGVSYPLHSNRWGSGAIAPAAYRDIESFSLEADGTPRWTYRLGAAVIEHRIAMIEGNDAVRLHWRLVEGSAASLRVRLLATHRDHHGGEIAGMPASEWHDGALHVRFGDREPMIVTVPGGTIEPREEWVRDFALGAERDRGLDDRETLCCVGEARLELDPGQDAMIQASFGPVEPRPAADRIAEVSRVHPEYAQAPAWVRRLLGAADSFLFERPIGNRTGRSVIAGYPWFGDWGRDTMIALPGLTLATGKPEAALAVLRTFLPYVDRGMLPNYFPGAGEIAEYNTVDAALWFVEAWRAYYAATGDTAAIAEASPVLRSIIEHHSEGTRYGIGRDPADGLLRAGEPGVQLTWMDAKVGDWVVTPRIGKPIEINALWYNALRILADFAGILGENAAPFVELADQVRQSFTRYSSGDGGGLKDVLDPDDPTIRPNQIFAASLHHSPLDPESAAAALRAVRDHLLTSYGLRSLAPGYANYRPRYEGGVLERDGSYHQGTVWPWLLGPYALAEYRVTGDARLALSRLDPIADHLLDAGLGTVSEIMDADPPHEPRGCPAQAWSVACILDAWLALEKFRAAGPRQGAMQ